MSIFFLKITYIGMYFTKELYIRERLSTFKYLLGGTTFMKYAISFNSKFEFDRAYKVLKQAGLMDEMVIEDSPRLEPMQEIPCEPETIHKVLNNDHMHESDELIANYLSTAREYDMQTAIRVMQEYHSDRDYAKAIEKLKGIIPD